MYRQIFKSDRSPLDTNCHKVKGKLYFKKQKQLNQIWKQNTKKKKQRKTKNYTPDPTKIYTGMESYSLFQIIKIKK